MFESKILLDQLEGFPGEFECHITVGIGEDEFPKFERFCEDEGVKAILIELASGENPRQPMLGTVFQSDPKQVYEQIQKLCTSVSENFPLLRLKVEASIHNANIPNEEQIASMSASCYFEHHVKITMGKNDDLSDLREALKTYHGHLSRNPKQRSDLNQTRFITQRLRFGNVKAEAELLRLIDFLESENIVYEKVIREFNIFDTNIDLDAGWCDVGK